MPNRYFFSDLEPIPGMIIAEGYAVIRPGTDWTIEEIYIGCSGNNLLPVNDPRLASLLSEALERDCAEEITAQFGCDLNAGLYLGAADYGVGRWA